MKEPRQLLLPHSPWGEFHKTDKEETDPELVMNIYECKLETIEWGPAYYSALFDCGAVVSLSWWSTFILGN